MGLFSKLLSGTDTNNITAEEFMKEFVFFWKAAVLFNECLSDAIYVGYYFVVEIAKNRIQLYFVDNFYQEPILKYGYRADSFLTIARNGGCIAEKMDTLKQCLSKIGSSNISCVGVDGDTASYRIGYEIKGHVDALECIGYIEQFFNDNYPYKSIKCESNGNTYKVITTIE